MGLHIDYPPVKLTWLWKPWPMKKEDLPMEMGIFMDFPVRYVTNDQRVPYFPHSHVAEESLYILLWSS